MKLDFYHNKIVADTITAEFEDAFRKELLPLLEEKCGVILEAQMYEDYISLSFADGGYWYYPLTILNAEGISTQWVRWPFTKADFEDGSPYAFIGSGKVGFEIADEIPDGFAEKLEGRSIYYSGEGVKVRVDIVGGDPVLLSGKYSQTFIDEMSRQLASVIENATGVSGVAESSVELVMVFAPGTYMEHTSENVTYRRLMLLDRVSAPRDFWIQWTRLDGAVAHSVSSHVNSENILFELGEDVDQKIREKEYRYLLSSGKEKYHNAMGRKKVTEWREVIKRAARRGELCKIESDFELSPETIELEERIADLLGKRPANRGGYEKEEIPFITGDDEFERAMEKMRLVVEHAAEESEAVELPACDLVPETAEETVPTIDEELLVLSENEEIEAEEEKAESEEIFEQVSLETEESESEEEIESELILETDEVVEAEEIADDEASDDEIAEEEIAVSDDAKIDEDSDEDESVAFETDETDEAEDDSELELVPEAEEGSDDLVELDESEIESAEAEEILLEDNTDEQESEEVSEDEDIVEEFDKIIDSVAAEITEDQPAEEDEREIDIFDIADETVEPAEEIPTLVSETAPAEETTAETEKNEEEFFIPEPVVVKTVSTPLADRAASLRAEIEAKIRLEYETRARAKAEQELVALRREQQKLKLETEAMLAEAMKEQERLRLEYEHLLRQTERQEAQREAEEEQRRAEEEQLRAQIEAQLRAEAKERERLAEAARMAIEEQHRLEVENARIARQRAEEERIEAEKQRKIEEERQLEELRRAELERIRREDEEAKARAKAAMPEMGDGKYSYTSKSVKLLFRKNVDPNITTRIYEIMKATVEYYGKDRIYLKIRATVADTQTVVLDFEHIPIEEMALLGNIIKILGNSGLGIAKAIVE